MLLSILHRATGVGLATAGVVLLVWWLAAAAAGEETYGWFIGLLTTDQGFPNIVGLVLLIGLTWAFFTHFFNGLRHFVLDTGAGYELRTNRRWSIIVLLGALFATAALWIWLFAAMLPAGAANG